MTFGTRDAQVSCDLPAEGRAALGARDGQVVELSFSIRRQEVLHFLGYPEAQEPPARIDRLIGEALDEARDLMRPRGACVSLPVSAASSVGLEAVEASGLLIGLVTIGSALEGRAAALLAQGEATRALILDAAGSAAAEQAADRLGFAVTGDVSAPPELDLIGSHARVSCRISPGYGRWALRAQRALFAALPHAEIGVSLCDTMLMVPRKSISFAMWLGAGTRPIAGLSGCARCELDHCRYRRAPRGDGS